MTSTGEELKQQGMARAVAGAPESWKSDMLDCIKLVCENNRDFTTDKVFALAETLGVETYRENRAMGALMVKAAKAGWCKKTETFPETRPSERPELHRTPLQIWVSLIYKGA